MNIENYTTDICVTTAVGGFLVACVYDVATDGSSRAPSRTKDIEDALNHADNGPKLMEAAKITFIGKRANYKQPWLPSYVDEEDDSGRIVQGSVPQTAFVHVMPHAAINSYSYRDKWNRNLAEIFTLLSNCGVEYSAYNDLSIQCLGHCVTARDAIYVVQLQQSTTVHEIVDDDQMMLNLFESEWTVICVRRMLKGRKCNPTEELNELLRKLKLHHI